MAETASFKAKTLAAKKEKSSGLTKSGNSGAKYRALHVT